MKNIYNRQNIPSWEYILTMSGLPGDIMIFLVKMMDLWVFNNGYGRIRMTLGLEQRFLASSVMDDIFKHHTIHLFYGISGL